jgi:hypothetical protein
VFDESIVGETGNEAKEESFMLRRSLRLSLWLWLASFTGSLFLAYGQTSTLAAAIDFGNIPIIAGMSKTQVLTALAGKYIFNPPTADNPTRYVTTTDDKHSLVGYLIFEAEVLVKVGVLWASEDTAYSAVHTIGNILDKFKGEGFSSCFTSFSKQAHAEQQYERETLFIDCGQKAIEVSADKWSNKDGNFQTSMIWESATYIPAPVAKKRR